MNIDDLTYDDIEIDTDTLTLPDRYILSRLSQVIREIDDLYERYEFGEVAKILNQFSWEEFAAWYVEIAKIQLQDDLLREQTKSILAYVLLDVMKLLHPFMPFVTDEIYQNIPHDEESVMIASWPESIEEFDDQPSVESFKIIQELIRTVRNARANYNVAPSKKIDIMIKPTNEEYYNLFVHEQVLLEKFINPEHLVIDMNQTPYDDMVTFVSSEFEVYIPLGNLVDIKAEIERLKSEQKRLIGEQKRCQGMLSNEKFVAKAPKEKVEEERAKLKDYQDQYERVSERISELEHV
jgi:valyl-tRNA synthetase